MGAAAIEPAGSDLSYYFGDSRRRVQILAVSPQLSAARLPVPRERRLLIADR